MTAPEPRPDRPLPPPHICVEVERLARHLDWPLPWPAPCLHCSGSFARHDDDCSLAAEAMRTFMAEVDYLDAHPWETERRRPMTESEVRIHVGELGLALPDPPGGFTYDMSGELVVHMAPNGEATAECLNVDVELVSYRYDYDVPPTTSRV